MVIDLYQFCFQDIRIGQLQCQIPASVLLKQLNVQCLAIRDRKLPKHKYHVGATISINLLVFVRNKDRHRFNFLAGSSLHAFLVPDIELQGLDVIVDGTLVPYLNAI